MSIQTVNMFVGQTVSISFNLNNNIVTNNVVYSWTSNDNVSINYPQNYTGCTLPVTALAPSDPANPVIITGTATITVGTHTINQSSNVALVITNPIFSSVLTTTSPAN